MTSAPRVAHLAHTTVAGGAELGLARMLRADPPWTASLLLPPEPAEDGVFADLPGSIPIHRIGVAQPYGASGASSVGAVAMGARLLAQAVATRTHRAFRQADLVVANSTRAAAYGALAATGSRTPFLVYLHDIMDRETLGGFGLRMMTKVVLPRADGVIANSQATLASAEPHLRRNAVREVMAGASGLTGRPRGTRAPGPLRVGMLARIDPWKGQLLLLDAFARAFPDGDEILEFAGGAPFGHADYADELRGRAEALGLAGRVRLLGHVDDVASLLRRWDVGVQASMRAEPLGFNVLEYLDAGLATVVAAEGGPAEWVHDGVNGLSFAPRDPEALAAALRRLGADGALRARLSEAAPRTPGLATDHAVAESHAEAYRRVLAHRR
ncbi:glycosyltransferase family 4 protein [Microbacterium sp. Au-Mic1]|uniref:glycosyltransferase family 4 protein n=1 Tax=Microbacterium sp. Au-Mic1 TaxID=2906457 RepID=UPI001E3620F7|nr:glycosyltransferase family 4 protein [Microbacterium sp. Au-Mic1]MCE4027829.1 glycosyltransferase family 4 protein [Microbacterium sp. Au-Mic1]